MKTTQIQLIVFLFISQIVVGQNCNSNFVKQNYRREAQRAAREEMLASPNSYNKTIEIPEVLVNKYLKCFNSIYYSNYSCVDTIFSAHQPIVDNCQGTRLSITVPKTEEWLNELEIGKLVCGNSALESLLCSYSYRLRDTLDNANSVLLYLESDSIYNDEVLSEVIYEKFNYQTNASVTSRVILDGYSIPENFETMDTISYMFVGLDYLKNDIRFIRDQFDSLTNYPLGSVFYYFTADTTCNAKLLRTHYADYSQINESCPIDIFIRSNYYRDASFLAYNNTSNQEEQKDSIVAPELVTLKYLKAINSVFLSGYPCVDTIFKGTNSIHTIGGYFATIKIEDNASKEWVQDATSNGDYSQNIDLYHLLSPLGYTISRTTTISKDSVEIELESNKWINVEKLVASIQNNLHLKASIDYRVSNKQTQIVYLADNESLSFTEAVVNDSTGTSFNKYYEFTFDTTCNAKLLRTHYADYSTNSTQIEESTIEVYPNPVATTLHLQNVDLGTLFHMYNFSGSLLKEGSAESPIDVSSLSQGMYILRLVDKQGGIQQYKIMKQ